MQVRTFLDIAAQVNFLGPDAHATLARSVEGWAFHETMLEQGQQVLRSKLLEGCVFIASTGGANDSGGNAAGAASGVVPPALLGHLDTLTVLLANDVALRRQIMAALRKALSPRQFCLLLVVQVRDGYSVVCAMWA